MRSITFFILCLTLLASCRKENVSAPADFTAALAQGDYKAGDTVRFLLSGDPGTITFYSGEAGRRYENRGRRSGAGTVKMVFQTSMQQGPVPPAGQDSLQLLISTDLKGYDADNILKANWTSITGRNKKWPTTLATSFTTSDSIDITDFNSAEKINIAFRFLGKKTGVTAQRKWQLQNLTVHNFMADGNVTAVIGNFPAAGWVHASLKNDSQPGTPDNGYNGFNAWNVGTWGVSTADSVRNSNGIVIRSSYPLTFNPGVDVNNEDNDDWLISSAVDLKTVKPDAGTVFKNELSLRRNAYWYVFKNPGTYHMAFVAVNAGLKNSETVVRELTVTVLPR